MLRPKSYGFSGKSIQDLIMNQSFNCNLMHSYITVLFNNLIANDKQSNIHIFPPVFLQKIMNMQNYHFLEITEYFDKNYCFSNKQFGEKSMILYVIQDNSDFVLVAANFETHELIVFNPRQSSFEHNLETFTADLISSFSPLPNLPWIHDKGGICPLISPNISSGLIIAQLLKLICTGQNLEHFRDSLSAESIDKMKNQMVLELISNKLM